MQKIWLLCLFLNGICAYPSNVQQQQQLSACINKCLQSIPDQDCCQNCKSCVQEPQNPITNPRPLPQTSGCYCAGEQVTQPTYFPSPGWMRPQQPAIQLAVLWPPNPNCCQNGCTNCLQKPTITYGSTGKQVQNVAKLDTPIIQKQTSKGCCQNLVEEQVTQPKYFLNSGWRLPQQPLVQQSFRPLNLNCCPNRCMNCLQNPVIINKPTEKEDQEAVTSTPPTQTNEACCQNIQPGVKCVCEENEIPQPTVQKHSLPKFPVKNLPLQQCCSNAHIIQGCIICFQQPISQQWMAPMYPPMLRPVMQPIICHPLCFGSIQCCNSWVNVGGKW